MKSHSTGFAVAFSVTIYATVLTITSRAIAPGYGFPSWLLLHPKFKFIRPVRFPIVVKAHGVVF